MPEANALFAVTAVVVLGLVVWVAAALKLAKEPWARAAPQAAAPQTEAEAALNPSAYAGTSPTGAGETKSASADPEKSDSAEA